MESFIAILILFKKQVRLLFYYCRFSQSVYVTVCQKLNCSLVALLSSKTVEGSESTTQKNKSAVIGSFFSFLTITFPRHSLSEMAIVGHIQSKLQICVDIMMFFVFFLFVCLFLLNRPNTGTIR